MSEQPKYRRARRKTPARDSARVTIFLEPSLWKRLQMRAQAQHMSTGATAEALTAQALAEGGRHAQV